MTLVVMRCRNATFRPPRDGGGDNYELPLVRPRRIYRRCVDHSCVSAPATRETPKLVAEVFTIERSRSTADNRFAHLRLQFVSVHRGGVLVFDQLGRAMEITQCQKTFEAWLAMGTINPRERCMSGDVRVIDGVMWNCRDRIPTDVRDRREPRRSRARARSQGRSVAAPLAAPE